MIDVYVERGSKRAFASAIDWPGWSRNGKDEDAALDALLDSAPRYAKLVGPTRLRFRPPKTISDLRVVERVRGDATTDFGAPSATPTSDAETIGAADLKRIETLIAAAWRALDGAVARAKGKTLAKGPRGGGRALGKIVDHVREAEAGYLSGLGWKFKADPKDAIASTRRAVIDGLRAAARGQIPAKGPRGGVRWTPRKFARRLAWHAIDHAWEIDDRSSSRALLTDGTSPRRVRARPTPASGRAPRGRTRTRARR